MPPKKRFEKETIANAAFEIAREGGFAEITARNVAERLGCSVAPIYVNYACIDELKEDVVEKIFELTEKLLEKQEGKTRFEKIGLASLAFAREYPIFVNELILKPNQYLKDYQTIEEQMIESLSEDADMAEWSAEERRKIFLKMRIFQVGLQVLTANGHIPKWLNERKAEELIMETAKELLTVRNLEKNGGI